MNASVVSIFTAVCLSGSVLLGMLFRRLLPEPHLSKDTKEVVKLAMGLVATMTALVLGLLVSSAKSSYDTTRNEVIQIGAKITFLDRVLGIYGSETGPIRAQLRVGVQDMVSQMWSKREGGAVDLSKGNELYVTIQTLVPQNDVQRALKDQAAKLTVDIAQIRTLLRAQSIASISWPLLVVVVCWLAIIFFNFSMFAPANTTAMLSLLVAAISVAGSIFLIVEMDGPFYGPIQISSEPMVHALSQSYERVNK